MRAPAVVADLDFEPVVVLRSSCTLADAARAAVHLDPVARTSNRSWFVLTGCRKGTVPAALLRDGPAAARRALDELINAFGRDRVLMELWDHGDPIDRHRNDELALVAAAARPGTPAGRRRGSWAGWSSAATAGSRRSWPATATGSPC